MSLTANHPFNRNETHKLSKIFGIGLPKSGTSTLHEALTVLGYRCHHNPDDPTTENQLREGDYELKVLERYDVLSDTPIPAIFAQLDQQYPDSLFILTTRDVDAWIASSRKAGFNQDYARPKKGSTVDFYNSILFGCSTFNEERYRWVYETHLQRVKEHFSGERASRLLTIDFTQGQGWPELCEFLGKPIPSEPIPHANALSNRRELGPFGRAMVGVAVRVGFDYRTLRRWYRRLS